MKNVLLPDELKALSAPEESLGTNKPKLSDGAQESLGLYIQYQTVDDSPPPIQSYPEKSR